MRHIYYRRSLGGRRGCSGLEAIAPGCRVSWATVVAIAAVVLAVLLLYRNLARIQTISIAMGAVVMATIGWILVTGMLHANWHQAFLLPPGAFHLTPGFFAGLGSAMLIATYDYWGYYNVTFLGGEVRDPARTIPRAILISIGLVAALYLAMNVMVLAVVPWQTMIAQQDLEARRAIISIFMETAYGPKMGPLLGKVAAALIMFTAFAGDLFAAAGVFSDTVCGGAGWELFQGVCQAASDARVSVCFAVDACRGGGAVLFLSVEGCDCGAGGAADSAAVPDAACGSDLFAKDAAEADKAISVVAVSGASAGGDCGVWIHPFFAGEL